MTLTVYCVHCHCVFKVKDPDMSDIEMGDIRKCLTTCPACGEDTAFDAEWESYISTTNMRPKDEDEEYWDCEVKE